MKTDFPWNEIPSEVRREDLDLFRVSLEGTEFEQALLTLPVMHVETCLQLLKKRYRLTYLPLKIEEELIDITYPKAFEAKAGI